MFQQPNYSDPGKHISTSSSVYPDSNSTSPESSPRIPGAFEQIIIPRHKENPFRTKQAYRATTTTTATSAATTTTTSTASRTSG